MRIMIVLVLVFFTAMPALADVIRVKQDDGTVVEIEMGGPEGGIAAPLPEEPAAQPAPARAPEAKGERVIPSEEETFQPKVKARSLRDALGRPVEDKPVEQKPVQQAPEAKKEQPKAEKPKSEPKTKSKKSKSKKSKAKNAAPAESKVEHVIPPGIPMTQELAVSIAMDAAPPSSGYTTEIKSYEGQEVFLITFKTEDGPYDVLVNAEGKIVRRGYVEIPGAGETLPGHLPKQ